MALIQKKTAEEKAELASVREQRRREQEAAKEEQRRETEARKRLEQIERARQAFFTTPAGRARLAFDRGDHVFQYAFDVMSQQAVIVPMVGSTTSKSTSDPSEILNSVCREGWELVNGSFVFVEQGQQSRDKFMSSGQNVAIKGTTVGYYLFKSCETNRQEQTNPWEDAASARLEQTTDEAIALFESGEIEEAATMLRSLRAASAREDEDQVTAIDKIVSEMRELIDGDDLDVFNKHLLHPV
jgi:hypothetical protein